jgi:hypothetical protein
MALLLGLVVLIFGTLIGLVVAGPLGAAAFLAVMGGVLILVLLVRLDRRVFDRNRKPRPDDRYRGPKV